MIQYEYNDDELQIMAESYNIPEEVVVTIYRLIKDAYNDGYENGFKDRNDEEDDSV